jgi:hypothetical protein
MGACVSSNTEETEQKKRSQMIDRALEEDLKKLRRECKILLLGRCYVQQWLGMVANISKGPEKVGSQRLSSR